MMSRQQLFSCIIITLSPTHKYRNPILSNSKFLPSLRSLIHQLLLYSSHALYREVRTLATDNVYFSDILIREQVAASVLIAGWFWQAIKRHCGPLSREFSRVANRHLPVARVAMRWWFGVNVGIIGANHARFTERPFIGTQFLTCGISKYACEC